MIKHAFDCRHKGGRQVYWYVLLLNCDLWTAVPALHPSIEDIKHPVMPFYCQLDCALSDSPPLFRPSLPGHNGGISLCTMLHAAKIHSQLIYIAFSNTWREDGYSGPAQRCAKRVPDLRQVQYNGTSIVHCSRCGKLANAGCDVVSRLRKLGLAHGTW